MTHYQHRAGIKVFHHCCPLIAELKPPPSRFFNGAAHNAALRGRLRSAITDLIEYLSAYFECNSESQPVIALAGAGPFWTSAVIWKTDLPTVDWRTKRLPWAKDPKVADFYTKFGDQHFILGSTESDEELSRINRMQIFPILRNGHYTDVTPTT